jgi:hypothetical protein
LKTPSSAKWKWVLLAIGAATLGILVVVALGLVFGRQWLVKPGWSGPPEVQILQPYPGQAVERNDEIPVFVRLASAEPVSRIELWVDGVLSASLDPEDLDEPLPAEVAFRWRLAKSGHHVFVARSVDESGIIGTSRPVIIRVEDDSGETWIVSETLDAGETVESIAANLGIAPDDILAANPDAGVAPTLGTELSIPIPRNRLPAGYLGDDTRDSESEPALPQPDALLGEGGKGEGPAQEVPLASPRALPAGLTWNLGPAGLPTAPKQIALAAAGDCTVEVRFSDDSDSEAGFRVYRWGPASSDFDPVAELGPNRTHEVLTFDDQVPYPGLHLYYVSAASAWGEAVGAMARVLVSEDECDRDQPPPDARAFPLKLEVIELATSPSGSIQRPYCYLSLAFMGGSHLRLPSMEDAFFEAQGEGWNIADHAAGSSRFAFQQPIDQAIPFGMECWGWSGDDLIDLGSFEVNLPPEMWLESLPEEFSGEGAGPDGMGFQAMYRISVFLPENIEFVPFSHCFEPCDYEIPAPYDLEIADSVDDCIDGHVNLPGGDLGEGAVAAEWACLELDPNQMLVWEWDETAGIPRSQTQGFQVLTYLSSYAWRNRDYEWVDVVGSAAQVMPRRMPPCEREYVYEVRTYVYYEEADGSVTELRSQPSEEIGVQGRACPQYRASFDLRLESLHIEDSSDVDGAEALCWFCDQDVTQEAYGLLRVNVDTGSGEEEVGRIILWDDVCGTVGGLEPCGDGSRHIGDGEYDLAQETMTSCETAPDGSSDCTSHENDRNRVTFTIYDGDEIWVYLTLFDHDTATGDDIFCSGVSTSGTVNMDADSWRREGSIHPLGIFDDNDETSCAFYIHGEVISVDRIPQP